MPCSKACVSIIVCPAIAEGKGWLMVPKRPKSVRLPVVSMCYMLAWSLPLSFYPKNYNLYLYYCVAFKGEV